MIKGVERTVLLRATARAARRTAPRVGGGAGTEPPPAPAGAGFKYDVLRRILPATGSTDRSASDVSNGLVIVIRGGQRKGILNVKRVELFRYC